MLRKKRALTLFPKATMYFTVEISLEVELGLICTLVKYQFVPQDGVVSCLCTLLKMMLHAVQCSLKGLLPLLCLSHMLSVNLLSSVKRTMHQWQIC